MARSQEALAKRAEKRSVPLAEQRLNDARKKTKTSNSSENTDEKKAIVKKKPVVKAPVIPIKDTNDWICTKCTNKNFHHRDTCNRCQETRASQAVKAPERTEKAEETVTATASKEKNVEVTKSSVGAVLSNGNWCCTACNNENFPTRTECNRCQLDRPSTGSSSSGKDKKIKIVPKAPPADRIAKGKGPISGKSLSWGKQASDSEIAENNRLREAMVGSEGTVGLTTEELARAQILKERSQRKKDKKEKQLKWKAKKLNVKSNAAAGIKSASILTEKEFSKASERNKTPRSKGNKSEG